jgi:DNA-binding CsgD family transcriptional regulator
VRIATSDVRRIVRFLDATPSGTRAEVFAPSTLRTLTGVIGAEQADYFELRGPDRHAAAFTTAFIEDDTSWVDEVIPRVSHQNPLGSFNWGPADGPLRMSAVIGLHDLRQLDYYREFLRPARIRDRLRVWLWRAPEVAACMTLIRSDRDFTDRDVALLAVLQPHLIWLRRAAVTDAATSQPPEADLTIREAQVVTLAAIGNADKEIGQLLSTSPATVRKHLEHAYRKLHADGRSDAAAWLRSGRPT